MLPPKLTDVTEHAFSAVERQAVYRAIEERRDMRRFVPDTVIRDDVLTRMLRAAHAAPSVGLMQPWRFIRVSGLADRTCTTVSPGTGKAPRRRFARSRRPG